MQVCEVLTRDLSRGGLCFLYSKPLFQSQRVDLQLPDGRKLTLAIRRVTSIAERDAQNPIVTGSSTSSPG